MKTSLIFLCKLILVVAFLFYKSNVMSQVNCAQSSLLIKTGWDYNTNSNLPAGSIDPYWWVISDDDISTIEPRPSMLWWTNSVNSGSLTNTSNNWCCETYSNVCGPIPTTPCTSNPNLYPSIYQAPGGSYPDAARVFNYTFCISPGTNLSALTLTLNFDADDFGRICLNGNYIGNSFCPLASFCSYTVSGSSYFQIGINVISVSLYNLGGSVTYFYVDAALTTSISGVQPFNNPNCCTPLNMICGQKYWDANRNGVRDFNETKISNWTINLSNSSNIPITSTQTDVYGNYFFSGLTPGIYIVSESTTSGFYQTYPNFSSYTVDLNLTPICCNNTFGNALCNPLAFDAPITACLDPILFSTGACNGTYFWDFGDGSFGSGSSIYHTYTTPGNYLVKLTSSIIGQSPYQQTITINNCQPPLTCSNCIGSFAPDPGNYILSAWVREDVGPSPITYGNARVEVSFIGSPIVYNFGTDVAKNKVIDGWQRIEESFIIPGSASHVNLKLINNSSLGGVNAYFDDIRILPKDGQMKTYVYDPITLKLSAVLDENNYATFYEYDEEGKLVRVKKETEKGIMTIQENRESLKKK
jgi:hypothetical protein